MRHCVVMGYAALCGNGLMVKKVSTADTLCNTRFPTIALKTVAALLSVTWVSEKNQKMHFWLPAFWLFPAMFSTCLKINPIK